MRVVLSVALRAQLAREAAAAYPSECCGLLEGIRRADAIDISAVHPVHNLSAAKDRFEIDPTGHVRAQRAAREAGRAIVGCYHSHPDGSAEPSAADRAGAAETGFVWLILASGTEVAARAYVFDGSGFIAAELVEPGSLDPAAGARV